MMGHPDLLPEVDISALGPLMSPELVDQTERKYVVKVKVSEWDSTCATGTTAVLASPLQETLSLWGEAQDLLHCYMLGLKGFGT